MVTSIFKASMSKIRRHNAPFSVPAIYTIWSHKLLMCPKRAKRMHSQLAEINVRLMNSWTKTTKK